MNTIKTTRDILENKEGKFLTNHLNEFGSIIFTHNLRLFLLLQQVFKLDCLTKTTGLCKINLRIS